jgi:hypothetical protein
MPVEYVRSTELDDDIVREWNQMATLVNEIKADFNALLAKLDLDAGVTDTNYASLRSITSADVDTFYLGF